MKEKVFAVLGTAFKKKTLQPRPLLKARLDFVYDLYLKGLTSKIIVCGGSTQKYKKKAQPSESEIMKNYLLKKNIKKKYILKESQSLNTIGNLAYLKKILDARKIKNVSIITNNIFVNRVKYLVKKIFQKEYKIEVIGCNNKMSSNFQRWIRFSESFWLDYCYPSFFSGVKRGDSKEIIKRLKNKEAHYPDNYRQDYLELKRKYFSKTKRKVKHNS